MNLRRRVAVCAVALAGGVAIAAVGYLRADKRHVFRQVAGAFHEARVLERADGGGYSTRLLEMVNDRGEAVSTAWVRRPDALAADYRIVMVYGGANTGKRILDLVPRRSNLVLVSPQYPYRRPESLAGYASWPRDVRRAVFRGVAGGMLAVACLEQSERLDLRRLVLVGSSIGTPFAVLHAALDARLPQVLLVHGGGDFPLVLRSIGARRGRPWLGRVEALLAEALVDSFDPLHYVGEISPRRLLVIGARDDKYFPPASTLALYERAGEPKRLLWTEGAHVASRQTPALDQVLRELERYLEPAPRQTALP